MKWNAWGDPAEAKPLSDGHSIAAQAGARRRRVVHGRTRARAGQAAAVGAVARRSRRAGGDRRRRVLRRRRPRPAAARRRQVHAGPVAPQGLRRPGRARRGAAARRRRRDRGDSAVLRGPQHRGRPVRRRHQRGRRPGSDPRRLQGRDLAGPAPAEPNCTRSTRSPAKPNWAPASPDRTPNGCSASAASRSATSRRASSSRPSADSPRPGRRARTPRATAASTTWSAVCAR